MDWKCTKHTDDGTHRPKSQLIEAEKYSTDKQAVNNMGETARMWRHGGNIEVIESIGMVWMGVEMGFMKNGVTMTGVVDHVDELFNRRWIGNREDGFGRMKAR